MNKKILTIIYVLFLFSITTNVDAESNNLYINNNGINVTKNEYNFICDFYGKDYFNKMTKEDYKWISDLNINNNSIYFGEYSLGANRAMANSSSHETNSKKLNIAKSCDNAKCTVITRLVWKVNPVARSYDVIGARFEGTRLYNNTITTKLSSSNGISFSQDNRVLNNGFGTSIKLPLNATNISIEQKYYVVPGGTIYASYQHSQDNISLQDSYSYVISQYGYGKVFSFYGNALDAYDRMGGVII